MGCAESIDYDVDIRKLPTGGNRLGTRLCFEAKRKKKAKRRKAKTRVCQVVTHFEHQLRKKGVVIIVNGKTGWTCLYAVCELGWLE